MNIKLIKNRADDLLKDCKPQVIRTLMIMVLVSAIPSLFGEGNAFLSFISFVLSILFLTFSHGQVVTALKVVRNNKEMLNDDDALVGFKRFQELFFTYFLNALILFAVAIVFFIFATMLFLILYGAAFTTLSSYSFNVSAVDVNSLVDLFSYLGVFGSSILGFFALFSFVVIVVILVLTLYLFAVPYLLEQYNIKGTAAISESCRFMKGNVWNLFKLQFSFIGWILLFVIFESVLMELLSFIPVLGPIIASIVVGIAAVYTYTPKYLVSMAIFFEEIAYYRYNSNQ